MHFYAMNDIVLNGKKIGRYMGDYIRSNKDRAYTQKEISQLLTFCDERANAFVIPIFNWSKNMCYSFSETIPFEETTEL
jgi:hypothetical protein